MRRHRDEDAHRGIDFVQGIDETWDIVVADAAALDLDDDGARGEVLRGLSEQSKAINTAIAGFLCIGGEPADN